MATDESMQWQRLGDGSLPTEDTDRGLGHIVSVDIYTGVYVSLIVLTFITLWAAFQDFGVLSLAVALFIATVKAAVVTLFFMHLNWENKIVWGIVIYPLFIFVLILLGTLGDASLLEQQPYSRPSFGKDALVVESEAGKVENATAEKAETEKASKGVESH